MELFGMVFQVKSSKTNSTKVCIEFVKEEGVNSVVENNSLLLNSPLIPTITTESDSDGNILNLKYTLPSGVTVYSPKAHQKLKNVSNFGIMEEKVRINTKIKHWGMMNYMTNISIYILLCCNSRYCKEKKRIFKVSVSYLIHPKQYPL